MFDGVSVRCIVCVFDCVGARSFGCSFVRVCVHVCVCLIVRVYVCLLVRVCVSI